MFLAGYLLGLCGALVFGPAASWALEVDTHLSCPSSVNVGATVPIDVVIENEECTAVDVRLLTGFVANSSAQNLGNTALHGPKVAASVELQPGDCVFPTGPSTLTLNDLPALPTFPAALGGKVAVLVLVTEWSGGVETDTCMLMPEPSSTLQLAAGVLGLVLVRAVGQRGTGPRPEKRR